MQFKREEFYFFGSQVPSFKSVVGLLKSRNIMKEKCGEAAHVKDPGKKSIGE